MSLMKFIKEIIGRVKKAQVVKGRKFFKQKTYEKTSRKL